MRRSSFWCAWAFPTDSTTGSASCPAANSSASPPLLLADEPTGNLDRKISDQVHQLLLDLNAEFGMTVVVVTHNPDLADMLGRQVTIVEGKLVDAG